MQKPKKRHVPPSVGPICGFGPLLISTLSHLPWREGAFVAAARRRISARRRRARSEDRIEMWRDRAWCGRAGQAFRVDEPGVLAGTTANSLVADHRGPQQDGRAGKAKLPAENCLRIPNQSLGPNASPLTKEPAAYTALHEGRVCVKGGRDIPATHDR